MRFYQASREAATGALDSSETPDAGSQGRRYASAIYGSIVSTSIIATLEGHASAAEITTTVATTMIVFWLAHTWAVISGERIQAGRRSAGVRVRELVREEWPMVQSCVGPVIVLALGWAGVLDENLAIGIAIAVGIVQLFGWGFALGRRVYDHWLGALLSGLGNGALGLALVMLEIAVSH